MSGAFSLVLNGIIIVLLAATIFYAARLSLHLREFRASRRDFDKLVADLNASIAKAQKSIEALRQSAQESGRDLQDLIGEARALSDELQLMGESGSNVASRLEKAADRGIARARPGASFAIRDPEFDEGSIGGEADESGLFPGEAGGDTQFSSKAERELYEALRGGPRRTKAGGVS